MRNLTVFGVLALLSCVCLIIFINHRSASGDSLLIDSGVDASTLSILDDPLAPQTLKVSGVANPAELNSVTKSVDKEKKAAGIDGFAVPVSSFPTREELTVPAVPATIPALSGNTPVLPGNEIASEVAEEPELMGDLSDLPVNFEAPVETVPVETAVPKAAPKSTPVEVTAPNEPFNALPGLPVTTEPALLGESEADEEKTDSENADPVLPNLSSNMDTTGVTSIPDLPTEFVLPEEAEAEESEAEEAETGETEEEEETEVGETTADEESAESDESTASSTESSTPSPGELESLPDLPQLPELAVEPSAQSNEAAQAVTAGDPAQSDLGPVSTPVASSTLGTSPVPKELTRLPEKAEVKAAPVVKKVKHYQNASYDEITPGQSTIENVIQRWGQPTNQQQQDNVVMHQFLKENDPTISEVQVMYRDQKVVSVITQFRTPQIIQTMAEKLQLEEYVPVMVSNPGGVVLGQAYPERGVSFAFAESPEPGKATMKVVRLILEPIQAEPFVLRAETLLISNPVQAEEDLLYALSLDGQHAHGHWLLARLQATHGELSSALLSVRKAIGQDKTQAQYYITEAQILGQLGDVDQALEKANQAIAIGENPDAHQTHLAARAWCLKGDLTSCQAVPDYVQALEYHTKAIKLADQSALSPNPTVSYSAKEVLIDAHLGAAHDIAWGKWNQKGPSVERWLNQAQKYAEDMSKTQNMIPKERCDQRMRVAIRSLSACAGVGKDIDPTPWLEQVVKYGDLSRELTENRNTKQRLSWDMGMAIYDGVQIYQARDQNDLALLYGQKAVRYMEEAFGNGEKFSTSEVYILGRLYFRIGAIYAINRNDHKKAVEWYKKTLPMFDRVTENLENIEMGRLGETLVSMGVSYWEIGLLTQAINLTDSGILCLEQAYSEDMTSPDTLEIPYRNMAMMFESIGKNAESKEYLQKADSIKAVK